MCGVQASLSITVNRPSSSMTSEQDAEQLLRAGIAGCGVLFDHREQFVIAHVEHGHRCASCEGYGPVLSGPMVAQTSPEPFR
jgi:hypothetical protein